MTLLVLAAAAPPAASGGASQPGASLLPDSTDLFTAANFALIAVLAVLVILGLLYGARQRRRRREAAHELAEHNAALETQTSPEAARVEAEDRAAEDAPSLAAPAPAVPPAAPSTAARVPARPLDEPVPAALPLEPLAAPVAPVGPSPADDPVTQLKGLGPKVAQRLADYGITTVGQMAALTDDEAASLDAHLGPFTGRMGRDRWQEQARFLAAGDVKGFEAVFGRL